MFRALQVTRAEDGSATAVLRHDLTDGELGEGTVTIDVEWSGINYKDGMAVAGNPGVMRANPLIPGIDLVGTIAAIGPDVEIGMDDAAAATSLSLGDTVLVNGWGIGETHNGGLSERARVSADWLVPVPPALSAKQAAAIGTAGFTAALAVLALERGESLDGDILVTGATGGVGSIAIALLAAAGHRVVAASGREEHRDYLLSLGAAEVISRAELEEAGRPLQKQRWAGVIDSVGGQTLATALSQTLYGGTVAACGMVGGVELPTTVLPFILRGVNLAGINSVDCPAPLRLAAWERLARDLDLELLDTMTTTVTLTDAASSAHQILEGKLHGRTVVDVRS
jgi:acrylyl-CoA reductase (NADPH)